MTIKEIKEKLSKKTRFHKIDDDTIQVCGKLEGVLVRDNKKEDGKINEYYCPNGVNAWKVNIYFFPTMHIQQFFRGYCQNEDVLLDKISKLIYDEYNDINLNI